MQSRAAAVDELMGEGPAECEVAYETALWMLYAISDAAASGPVKEADRALVDRCASGAPLCRADLSQLSRRSRPVSRPCVARFRTADERSRRSRLVSSRPSVAGRSRSLYASLTTHTLFNTVALCNTAPCLASIRS